MHWYDSVNAFISNPVVDIIVLVIISALAGSLFNTFIYKYPLRLFRAWKKDCEEYLKEYDEKLIDDDPTLRESLNCGHCTNPISKWHYFSSISFLFYSNVCEHCGHRFSRRPLIVEFSCLILALCLYQHYGLSFSFFIMLILSWALIVVSLIDLDHQFILDDIIYPLMWTGLLLNTFNLIVPIQQAVLGAILGYVLLFIPTKLYEWWRQAPAMGHGDLKMVATLGAWFGLYSLPFLVFGAFILAIASYLIRGYFFKTMFRDPLPFGPCLAIMALFIIFH